MRTLFRVMIVVAAAGTLGLSPASRAQQIPDSVITGNSVGADGQSAIRALIDSNKAGLTGDESTIKRSRLALQQPLRTQGISSNFRTAYGELIKSVLQPLIKDKRDEVAVSALAIAGELGTRDGMDLLADGLKDERAAVRARSALGFARTFTTCLEGTPALIPTQVESALGTLASAMSSERDAHVLDALGAAMEAAARIPERKLEGVRLRAVDVISSSVSPIVRKDGVGSFPLQMRVTRILYEVLRDDSVKIPEESVKQAAGLAGDALSAVSRRLGGADAVSEGDRSLLSLIATQSERVVISAGARLGAAVSEAKLGDMVAKNEDDRFRTEALKLASGEGVLGKAPFSLPADRFNK